jgi:hypothetical protein
MTPIRSASSKASSWSCVTKMLVMRSSRWIARRVRRSSVRILASRAPKRLVEEQDLRLMRERARERDPLLLAARELPGIRPPSPVSPTSSSSSSRRRRRSSALIFRIRSANSMFCATDMCGRARSAGTRIPTPRFLGARCVTSRPWRLTLAAVRPR